MALSRKASMPTLLSGSPTRTPCCPTGSVRTSSAMLSSAAGSFQRATELSARAIFGSALICGVGLGFAGLVGGLIVIAALVLAAVLTAATFGRIAFAGLALGLGGIWTSTFALAAVNCAGPGQPCGSTPIDLTPHIILSLGLTLLGAVALGAAARVKQDDRGLGGQ